MLIAQTRQAGEGLQNFRKAQKLPGVVYGHGFDSIPVVLNMLHFNTILREQGKGGLIDLKIDDAPPCKVLIHDYQIHPVKRTFIHVDFYRVRMDEKLRTEVPLVFIGEAPGVKEGGVLVKAREYVIVECLPNDLVSNIDIDLRVLKSINSFI